MTDELERPKMGLYLLRRHETSYDESRAFVVRAESREAARLLASEQCGDEGEAEWMHHATSTCEELTADGESGVIVRDYYEP